MPHPLYKQARGTWLAPPPKKKTLCRFILELLGKASWAVVEEEVETEMEEVEEKVEKMEEKKGGGGVGG